MIECAVQIKPVLNSAAPIWEHDTSDYPDLIKIAMEDGHVVTYVREIRQPGPRFLRSGEIAKLVDRNTYGGSKTKKGDKTNE